MSLHSNLSAIQSELSVPKGRENKFGGFNYRSCEDILDAVKPLLKKHNCVLTVSDEIVMLGTRFYVKATATLSVVGSKDESISVSALAREVESKTKMDDAQITGAASSYARKYALNGLFCIDDTKDADTMDNTKPETVGAKIAARRTAEEKPAVVKSAPTILQVTNALNACKTAKSVETVWDNAMNYEWSTMDLVTLRNLKKSLLGRILSDE